MPDVDIRFSELDVLAAPRLADEVVVNDNATTPKTRRSTIESVLSLVPGDRYPTQVGLWLPGLTTDYATTPDHADLGVTGDLDMRVDTEPDSWRPASLTWLLHKWEETGDHRSYRLGLTPTGEVRLELSSGGSGGVVSDSTAVVPNDDARRWVRATHREADSRAQFFTSDDGESWTKLGDDVTTTGVTTINVGTAPLVLGGHGLVYRARVLDGIDGTAVAAPSFLAAVHPRHRDLAGRVWSFVGDDWAWGG